MAQRIVVEGNEAVGWGAVSAGCLHFFGYPITPQNETTEWFARELPKRGGVFVQSQCETASVNMLMGAAAAGVRALTSTASPGWSLMLETYSLMCNAELPCVVVVVQRGGPGMGHTQCGQNDYISAAWGGGNGGYKNICLAPASVQETHDLVQLAFYLADKYRNPVLVLTDATVGQMREPLEVKTVDFGPLPDKDWVLRGYERQKDGQRRYLPCIQGHAGCDPYPTLMDFMVHLDQKWRAMATEARYEALYTDDAELVVVAFGYAFRVSLEAVEEAREEGLKVGIIRPISLWPFPREVVKGKADDGAAFLVVEDNLGQMVEDVRSAVEGKAQVHFIGALSRHQPTAAGLIYSDTVFNRIKGLLGG